jgi:phosphoglycolate phosphatase
VTVGVLWDLDGTLVDSATDIAAAMDRSLVAMGLPPLGEPRIRGFIGEGARRLVDRSVAAAGGVLSEAHVATFLREYRAAPVVATRIYAGIVALLERIAAPSAITTNKPEDLSREILSRLDLARFFPVVLGGDSLPTRKPDPEMLRVARERLGVTTAVLVGDGPADVGAAKAAGIPLIGVGWGITSPEGADVCVASVEALERALERFGVAMRG